MGPYSIRLPKANWLNYELTNGRVGQFQKKKKMVE